MSIVGSFRNLAGNALDYGSSLFNLPEWNISERLAGGQTMFTNVFKPNTAYAADKPATQTQSTPWQNASMNNMSSWNPGPVVKTGGGGGGGGNQSLREQMLAGRIPWDDNVLNSGNGGNNMDQFNAWIDSAYESAMGDLGNMETNLRGQADTATSGAVADYGKVKTSIGEEQATREAGLAREGQLATNNAKTATQQARDLFRETQQANIAQMSGLGISSSSVTEALAERLGVETARRIAGITGSTQEIMQNLAKEKTRVFTFFKEKLTNLEEKLTVAKQGIQDSLMAGIQQLNNARSMAASDKANRRAELLSNAQTAYYKAQEQKTNFEQAMKIWTEQKNTSLAQAQQFLINPTDFGAQTAWANQVSRLGQDTGFNYQPTFEPTATGQLKRSMTIKKDEEDDELANPFGA